MSEPITVSLLPGVGIAAVLARKGKAAEVARTFCVKTPDRPQHVRKAPYAVLGMGPGSWLVVRDERPADFLAALRGLVGNGAWVADQSGAYLVYRIEGPAAQVVLRRGVPIDLHPDAFGEDAVASTSIAHVTVILWRLAEADAFALAIPRSYEASFRHWLDATIAAL